MKNIRTLLIGALLLSTAAVFGQKEINFKPKVQKAERKQFILKTPEARAQFETKKMTAMLDLTEAQVARVSALNLKVENKIEAVNLRKITDEKKQEFIKGNLADRMTMLKRFLSKDQFDEYSASLNK